MELAYSGLHQLCGTMLDQLERLPEPQRLTLEVVFGLTAGVAPDPFLVALATLSLLSEVSEDRPLLCVVDDAHWLDQGSAMTLAFVARRLLAEHVGLVFAVREPNDVLRHLPVLEVGGLRIGDARALLRSAVRFKVSEQCATGSSLRRAATRWPYWSCLVASAPPNLRDSAPGHINGAHRAR